MPNETFLDSGQVLGAADDAVDLKGDILSTRGDLEANVTPPYGAGLDKYGAAFSKNFTPAYNGLLTLMTGVAHSYLDPMATRLVSTVDIFGTADGLNHSLATNLAPITLAG